MILEWKIGPGKREVVAIEPRQQIEPRVRVVRVGARFAFVEIAHAVAIVVGERGARNPAGPKRPGIGQAVAVEVGDVAGEIEPGGFARGGERVGAVMDFHAVGNVIVVAVGVARIGAGEILADIGEIVVVGIERRVGGVGRIEEVGDFPGIGHAVAVAVRRGQRGRADEGAHARFGHEIEAARGAGGVGPIGRAAHQGSVRGDGIVPGVAGDRGRRARVGQVGDQEIECPRIRSARGAGRGEFEAQGFGFVRGSVAAEPEERGAVDRRAVPVAVPEA